MSLLTQMKRAFKGTFIEKAYRGLRKSVASESELIAHREHEAMMRFFAKVLGPTSNAVDIGCHMGEMLTQFCELSPQGKHIAFEPIPSQAEWLRGKFPSATILQMALADKEGTLRFFHNVDRPAFSGLSVQRPEDKTEVLDVKVSTLDQVLSPDQPVSLVKIDVEGAELQVFRGAKRTVDKWSPAILFEFVDHASARHGAPADVFFEALETEFQLKVYLIEAWLNGGLPLTKDGFVDVCKNYKAYNFVAFKK